MVQLYHSRNRLPWLARLHRLLRNDGLHCGQLARSIRMTRTAMGTPALGRTKQQDISHIMRHMNVMNGMDDTRDATHGWDDYR